MTQLLTDLANIPFRAIGNMILRQFRHIIKLRLPLSFGQIYCSQLSQKRSHIQAAWINKKLGIFASRQMEKPFVSKRSNSRSNLKAICIEAASWVGIMGFWERKTHFLSQAVHSACLIQSFVKNRRGRKLSLLLSHLSWIHWAEFLCSSTCGISQNILNTK